MKEHDISEDVKETAREVFSTFHEICCLYKYTIMSIIRPYPNIKLRISSNTKDNFTSIIPLVTKENSSFSSKAYSNGTLQCSCKKNISLFYTF